MTAAAHGASAVAELRLNPTSTSGAVSTQLTAAATLQPPAAAAVQPFGARLAVGLFGIYIAAMSSGLNNRVAALALADVRGALGFSADQFSWLSTVYTAGELVAMPFATWFAVTLSLRRFHLAMLGVCAALAMALPFVRDLSLLLVLRGIQGVASGALIPVLMMAALRFLPAPIRLHGFALYSMTATFAPNLAVWFAGQWLDQVVDWHLVYWQFIPLSLLSMGLVAWGIPQDPLRTGRFAQADWFGCACGIVGLALLVVALDQGVRLDWFNSPLIVAALVAGVAVTAVFLLSEWHHPDPFIKLQLLGRRNLGLGFAIFVGALIVLLSGSVLPLQHLARIWDYRALQSAPIGLMIGLPQLILAPLVALSLYRTWVDARVVMSLGLCLIALACLLGSRLTAEWMWPQFIWAQALQACGQPMVVVALLHLICGVVVPKEGPYIAGTVNMLRALGLALGSTLIAQFTTVRERFHREMLLDNLGIVSNVRTWLDADLGQLTRSVGQEAFVLATADAYRVLGAIALALIPLALCLNRVGPPPIMKPASPTVAS